MSKWKIISLLSILFLTGCAKVQQLQNLDVSLTNIQPAGAIGLSPRFNIQLLISNPNAQALEIEGIGINLDIAGQKVLSGVSNQLPTLSAYSETPIDIPTTINLFSLYKLVTYLSQNLDEDIQYKLKTKVDPKGLIAFTINKEGVLNQNIVETLITQSQ